MASAAADGVTVTAIDPHAGNDRGPQQIHGTADEGQSDHDAFLANLAAAGVSDRVRHVRAFSHDALADVPDGPRRPLHRRRPPLRPGPRRHRRVGGQGGCPGGTLLIHDSFSSVGVTLALSPRCVPGGRFRYLGRDGSLARYRREDLRGAGRLRNAGRQLAQLAVVRPQRRDQGAARGPPGLASPACSAMTARPGPYRPPAAHRPPRPTRLRRRPQPPWSRRNRSSSAASSSPLGRSPAVKGSGHRSRGRAPWSSSS